MTNKRKQKTAALNANIADMMKSKAKMRMIDTLISFLNDGFKSGQK